MDWLAEVENFCETRLKVESYDILECRSGTVIQESNDGECDDLKVKCLVYVACLKHGG